MSAADSHWFIAGFLAFPALALTVYSVTGSIVRREFKRRGLELPAAPDPGDQQ